MPAFPPTACAACAARPPCGGWSPRPASTSTTWSPRCSCGRASTSPSPIASLPGVVQHTRESLAKEADRPGRSGRAGRGPLRRARRPRTPTGRGAWDPDGIVQVALRRPAPTSSATAWCSWPTCASTSTPTTATAASSTPRATSTTTLTLERYAAGRRGPGPRRRRRGRPQRDDGRPGRRPSAPASTPPATRDVAILRLRGQVRLGALRPVPRRGRRDHRRRRRPQGLPAGLPQPARGAGRGGPRHRRGRRHGDGQAGPRLPGRDRRRAGRVSTSRWPPTT